MNPKRWALFFYILVAGFGLWLGQSQADLIATGLSESVFNLLDNAAGVMGTVIGGIIIYILGGTQADVPVIELRKAPSLAEPMAGEPGFTGKTPVDVSHIGGPSSFESSIGKQH